MATPCSLCAGGRALVILITMVATTGCDRIYPYAPAEGDEASSTADRGIARDGLRPPIDQTPLLQDASFEGAKVNCQEPDSVQLAAICAQQNPHCAQGVVPSDDSDCDGLPLGADPDPDGCNRLVFADDFVEPFEGRWNVGAGAPSWSCGQVALPAGSRITFRDRPEVGLNQPYLIEVKFTVGEIINPDPWEIVMLQDSSPAPQGDPYGRYCSLWVNSLYQDNPGLHAWHGSPCGGGVWTPETNMDTSLGKQYILQTVYSGTHLDCRIYDSPGALVAPDGSKGRSACDIPAPGTWWIAATGIEATIHYVRIWEISSGF